MNLLEYLDRIPNPWNVRYLMLIVAASVVATVFACVRAGSGDVLMGCIILLVALAAVWFGDRSLQSFRAVFRANRAVKLIVLPLLFGVAPFLTSLVMGNPGAGGYPAVLSVLFSFVALATRDLEHRVRAESGGSDDIPVHLLYRGFLALISTVFFFLGVVTLWPWLGKLYGAGYFWILLIGVLAPTLSLWGKLRQPHKQNSMAALIRFNRVLPYLGLILLLAIVIG
jgi:hypothetical protein